MLGIMWSLFLEKMFPIYIELHKLYYFVTLYLDFMLATEIGKEKI